MVSKRSIAFSSFGIVAALFPFYVLLRSLSEEKINLIKFNSTGNPYEDWKECILENVAEMSKTGFVKWPMILSSCEGDITTKLDIATVKWGKEFSRLIYNKTVAQNPLIVSFGVGPNEEDVTAMIKQIKHENFDLIGGFPLDSKSKKLLAESSLNFPEEVESQNRKKDRISLQYYPGKFGAEEFKNFLSLWKAKKFFDAVWLDADAKEEEILPLSYKNNLLDQNGITVCQWHVMVHFGENNESMSNILLRILQDGRYAVFYPYPPGKAENQKMRLFSTPISLLLLNLENNECKSKYSPRLW